MAARICCVAATGSAPRNDSDANRINQLAPSTINASTINELANRINELANRINELVNRINAPREFAAWLPLVVHPPSPPLMAQ